MLTKSQKLLYWLIKRQKCVEDKTKLAKLEYFADFIHFAFNNSPISDQTIVYTRQKQGALSRSFDDDLEVLKKQGLITEQPKYHYRVKEDRSVDLSHSEKATIEYVLSKYGHLSFNELISLCHRQAPYLSAQDGGVMEFFTAYNLVDEYADYPMQG
jgi:uncharacterized phage-associated protein